MNKCGIILPPSHLRAAPHIAPLLLISQGDFHVPAFILTPILLMYMTLYLIVENIVTFSEISLAGSLFL